VARVDRAGDPVGAVVLVFCVCATGGSRGRLRERKRKRAEFFFFFLFYFCHRVFVDFQKAYRAVVDGGGDEGLPAARVVEENLGAS